MSNKNFKDMKEASDKLIHSEKQRLTAEAEVKKLLMKN
jgi:hypothetical protein